MLLKFHVLLDLDSRNIYYSILSRAFNVYFISICCSILLKYVVLALVGSGIVKGLGEGVGAGA